MTDIVVSAQGLRRSYGRGEQAFEAVRGVDLEIAEGEVFALLGTNGAGKTSTLDMLEGLVAPSAGRIEVFGLDPVRDRAQVRAQVGIMLQSGGLPAELTVAETLEMWRGTCSNPTTVDAVLTQVGLVERAGVRVGSLSGGEQRRVDLACALLGQPRLLFLDEPTTGLDPESRRRTWQLLTDLKAAGVTMVLTTHYLDEAESLADRIAIMDKGAVARRGTLREIVAGHPARIVFDHPGLPIPHLPGARVQARERVTVTTDDLQGHLFELLAWARESGVRLAGLDASAASLESVFLDIAGARPNTPELIGARR
ncbi:multidrug ABC transporter ATP-binding protein [Nocardia neocaledoniensis NBRC 108232]|uniref:ABC-2 type transport system ATP-binding protein n=1 Tax=Nocardia neocaledoniensis TaxID=236511 RepID=A0A317N765_9NOCA|nr:ABC transporter ATP-binding protein [Nocardia neocaledoniensis]PWV71121.1 ABC-2 type transport system ATP-binding protein [Nocardia neocaledoniensis]GEM30217.1 multidrug ABC transporter ATP-binding protein [Nocardia neocaledoniensis NBRC 108232]